MSDSEVRGDLADQAEAGIEAAERDAIRAALDGRGTRETTPAHGGPDAVEDEPVLDLGDPDDSDDPVHGGGDRIATSRSGAPEDDASTGWGVEP